MYLRETKRRRLDGSEVRYLQLAHNVRDPATGRSRAQVVHNFGRADQLDRDALARLVRSISRELEPFEEVAEESGCTGTAHRGRGRGVASVGSCGLPCGDGCGLRPPSEARGTGV